MLFRYVKNEQRTKSNIDPLLNEIGHLKNRNAVKEKFSAFFTSVFNTDELEDCDYSNNKLPTPNSYGICCSIWMHISLWVLNRFPPMYSKN